MSKFYTYCKHYGNNILYRGVENGKRITRKLPFSPTLFVPSKNESQYKSMFGEAVSPIKFDTNKEATEFVEQYKEVSNFPIYGQTHYGFQYLAEKFKGEIDWDISQVNVMSLDIETTVENGFPDVFNPLEQITLITLQDNVTKKIKTFGLGPFTPGEATKDYDVEYVAFDSEKKLLAAFVGWWANFTPDIVTGWNIKFFDIPYLIARMERVFGDEHGDHAKKAMSPFKLVRRKEKTFGGRTYLSYEIQGVSQLDYLDIYQKFTYVTRESYKLDHITEVELGHKKLENPYETFREFYTGESTVREHPGEDAHELKKKAHQRTLMEQELIRRGLLDASNE